MGAGGPEYREEEPRQGGLAGGLSAAGGVLLASLQREHRAKVYAFWGVLAAAVFAALFWPVFVAPNQSLAADPAGEIGALSAAERRKIRTATQVERDKFASLSFATAPLPPLPPPAQGARAIVTPALFGVPADRTRLFEGMAADLNGARVECSRWIGGASAEAQAAGAEAARAKMDELTEGSSRERGVYNYHQGLIELCGPNAPSAKEQFERALNAYEEYRRGKGAALDPGEARQLAQYETVTRYALGLSLMAAERPDRDAADRAFAQALEAAKKARAYRKPGPFVEMRTADCGGAGRDACELFNFTTADIHNARLYLWMSSGDLARAFRQTGVLAPRYVAGQPALAANYATAAAAAGHFDVVADLYAVVRQRLNAQQAPEWIGDGVDPRPRARLAAIAAVTWPPIYDDNDRAWWPGATRESRLRQNYDAKGFERDTWFPAVALGDENDSATIDLWLWIRRERALLDKAAFDTFRTDGGSIRGLGPGDREFLEDWRRAITGQLGEALLRRAETVRVKNGMRAAAPLLQLTATEDFPWWVRTKARISLRADAPPVRTLVLNSLAVFGVLLLAWIHLDLGAGYSRTFTRRHYDQRNARRRSAGPGG